MTGTHHFRRGRPKGGTTQRGYGSDHQRERARLAPLVAAGLARCMQPVCVMPSRCILPTQRWALGHTEDRTAWLGPVHAKCNQVDGARRGGRAALAQRRSTRARTSR
jgi:hypothetical protein